MIGKAGCSGFVFFPLLIICVIVLPGRSFQLIQCPCFIDNTSQQNYFEEQYGSYMPFLLIVNILSTENRSTYLFTEYCGLGLSENEHASSNCPVEG